MYGENGSGKSSVYFALYTLLQASIKGKNTDKYFDRTNRENLLNVFTEGLSDDAYIQVSFSDEPTKFYTLATGGLLPNTAIDIEKIDKLNIASDFISHRLLINFYNFKNSNQINLWRVFERDLIPYWHDRAKRSFLIELYEDIKQNVIFRNKKGNINARKASPKYLDKIKYFNEELEYLINQINVEATDFYNENFKKKKENVLEIKLFYQSDTDPTRDPIDTNKYWMRYVEVVKEVIIANAPQFYYTKYKDLTDPFIKLAIRENKGTSIRPIWKLIDRPQSYLNEAKLTGIALSIRFAMLQGTNRPSVNGRILALDDLLVSLDMSNRDKVIKVILDKFVTANPFKIYFFTHDRMFYQYAKHKIKELNQQDDWLYYETYNRGNDLPLIRQEVGYLGKAKEFLANNELEVSANFLRKEAEAFCKEFLPSRLSLNCIGGYKDLNGMITEALNFAKQNSLQLDSFLRLEKHRKFVLNAASHDSYDVAKFKGEIEECFDNLIELRKINIKVVLQKGEKINFELTDGTDTNRIEIKVAEDIKLIQEPTKVSFIPKAFINYDIYQNTVKTKPKVQHGIVSIKDMYDKFHLWSNKAKNIDYWEEVMITSSNQPLKTIRTF